MNEIILSYVGIKNVEPIIYCKYNKGVELGFPEIRELILCIETLSDKKPYLIFLDISLISNITNEGKRMMERYSDLPFCMGIAIFVQENRYECAQRLVDDNKAKFPFRAFDTEQEAVDWLLSLPLGH
ncbi:MAG TPA: hypothetical protein VNB90_11325 [Cytophagaceae bacterium]|nr:hypothetical protein [Cytophagaceae bacterium]